MKKAHEGVVWCVECAPWERFGPPNAAEKLREHYAAGKHRKRTL